MWVSHTVIDVKPRLADGESKPIISETDLVLPNREMNPVLVKEGAHICALTYSVIEYSPEVKPSIVKDEEQKPILTGDGSPQAESWSQY